MSRWIKRTFYFPIAYYFKFFAQIQLSFWKPRIIVVTGSSGKTTLLHLIESQLGNRARYSHHANSSFGIPFDILGIKRTNLVLSEWPYLFFMAPFKALKKPYLEKIYIVEADCDRPGEGKFLSDLLKPEVTLWISVSLTHSMNFDSLVAQGKFSKAEDAIAYEFGYFLEHTTKLVVINGDSGLMSKQLNRSKAEVKEVKKGGYLSSYKIGSKDTEFKIGNQNYHLSVLLPEENFYSLMMTKLLSDYLNLKADPSFSKFQLPPGRSSIFQGKNHTTLIDSSYNATLDGMTAILQMFNLYPAKVKWAVLGDMLEQGEQEKEEHEKLAALITSINLSKVILIGPRVTKYTYPKLKKIIKNSIELETFTQPKDALDYLKANLQGGETVLFKGARFLEGVIEHLLQNKNDVQKLCRREKIWQIRRRQWGL